jgi:DNA-binding response OmpR family regulator
MNVTITEERVMRELKQAQEQKSFQKEIEIAAARKLFVTPPAGNPGDGKLRVLTVDDHRATANTFSFLVSKWGHDVRCCYDGITGLALAAAYRPDVLLLDILMPEVSGLEVAVQVRRQNRLKDCFIIAITGRTDAKHRTRCYEAGVDLFLIKPVALTNLRTLLHLESERVKRLNGVVTMAETCTEFTATY